MTRFFWRRWGHRRVWWLLGLLGLLGLLMAQTTGKHTLMQEDIGVYNAALSSPGTLSSATLTQAQSDSASRCGTKCALFLTQGAWSLTTNHTISQPLVIPYGTRVTIASGMTLTLQACPKIDQPLWLQPGTTGKVQLTAAGCVVEVQKYATGGNGTAAAPWTGWESAMAWPSNSASTSGATFAFGCGYYKQTAPITLAGSGIHVVGCQERNTYISYQPASYAGANATAWTLGLGDANSPFNFSFEYVTFTSPDTTNFKRAIQIVDGRIGLIAHIHTPDGSWTGANSECLYLQGRELITVYKATLECDIPLHIGGVPPSSGTPLPYNMDFLTLRDDIFLAKAGSTNIWIDGNVFLTNFKTEGQTSMNRGQYGVYWVASGPVGSATEQMEFNNVRVEQLDTNGTGFYLDQTANTSSTPQGMTFHNVEVGNATSGQVIHCLYLRKWRGVMLNNVHCIADAGVHLNAADVYPITIIGSFLQTVPPGGIGVGISLDASMCLVYASGQSSYGGGLPGTGLTIYDQPATGVCPADPTIIYDCSSAVALAGETTPGVNTYTTKTCHYAVSSSIVTGYVYIKVNTLGTGGNAMGGNLVITGLPKIAFADSLSFLPMPSIVYGLNALTTNYTMVQAQIPNGAAVIGGKSYIQFLETNGSSLFQHMDVSKAANGSTYSVTFSYVKDPSN